MAKFVSVEFYRDLVRWDRITAYGDAGPVDDHEDLRRNRLDPYHVGIKLRFIERWRDADDPDPWAVLFDLFPEDRGQLEAVMLDQLRDRLAESAGVEPPIPF